MQQIRCLSWFIISVLLDSGQTEVYWFIFRSFIIEQDWSQSIKKSGTFILDESEMSTSLTVPSTIRSSSSTPRRMTDSFSRPSSRSKIPGPGRRSFCMETSLTNGSLQSAEDLAAAVRQVEETISPLARANSQIRDTLAQLERSVLALKTASNGLGAAED